MLSLSRLSSADAVELRRGATRRQVTGAVEHHRLLSTRGLHDRLFSLAFSGLVYAQIWEDPAIDMEALALGPRDRMVAIASGGCNIMSYLTADPAHITAVDLNDHHVALARLKIAAARTLPDHATFYDLFGRADKARNIDVYQGLLRPVLDAQTRAYWDGRDVLGRRRYRYFASNLYRHGLLGRFIGLCQAIGRLHRVDFGAVLTAKDRAGQRAAFDRHIAPFFDRAHIRWMLRRRASLYGLGIPPAQYDALAAEAGEGESIATVLRQRLQKLACGFDVSTNYFAWHAFGHGYKADGEGPVPPYLQADAFPAIQARANRIEVRHVNLIDHLRAQPAESLDAFVLLDAQDWMPDDVLATLWREITRTARPRARVIFRTAGRHSVLPGRVPLDILSRWSTDGARCRDLTARDRSAIYGGFHLYTLNPRL